MNRRILHAIIDELDSIQIVVKLLETQTGIKIVAKSEADRLMAKRECQRRGLTVCN